MHIGYQRRKTTVLSCHICLINTGAEKNEQHLNIDYNFYHKMSLSKSKCWYSNNCFHFLKCADPFKTVKSFFTIQMVYITNKSDKIYSKKGRPG